MSYKKFKKLIASTLILLLLSGKVFSVPVVVLAEEVPTPAAPSAPAAPQTPQEPTAPSAPAAPQAPQEPTAPSAPAAPQAPQEPTAPSVPKTPEAPTAPAAPSTVSPTPTSSPTNAVANDTGSESKTGGSGSGNVGDTAVTTGDASNNSQLTTTGNNNLASSGVCSTCAGGATVGNTGNGALSNNNASATTTTNNNTNQGNAAVVANNLTQATITGDNNTSYNVGDSSIDTGDANTTATVITSVNTNVDGVAVSEFNIVDDHKGDIILDFGANCVQGCGSPVAVNNANNGAFSTNDSEATTTTNNNTTQTNDAAIGSNLVLKADSGNNDANFNTGGDSNITTGDANVSANVLTFANNNIAGNVIYGVVNIFGDLVGDIILTEEAMNAACGGSCQGSTTASNTGNGAESKNTASANNTTNNNTFQGNDATINNTILFDATTGGNDTSFNTDGNSNVTTGDASLTANVLNVANSNINGGNWWLVIVNEGGRWLGKIMGSPDGANMAGSEGTEFVVDPVTGEVTAVNNANGAGSTNTASTTNTTNNTTTQTNNAEVNNTLDLTANTGGNKSSFNTGGDSNIVTGDAEIIANLVNFVNNNITGGGKLVVTVVNVFGSWVGDFVTPGQTKQAKGNTNTSAPQTATAQNTKVVENKKDTESVVAGTSGNAKATAAVVNQANTNSSSNKNLAAGTVKGDSTGTTKPLEATVAKSVGQDGSAAVADEKVTINLAWALLALPLMAMGLLIKKTFIPVQKLAMRGIHFFL